MSSSPLLVGTAEIDITPSVGALMAGNLEPRPSVGITDPLLVKVIVLEAGGVQMAYGIFDLIALDAEIGDRAVALASAATGIPAVNIIWSCTHTHSGPVSLTRLYPSTTPDPVDHAWLESLPERFAACVRDADARKEPARAFRARGYCHSVSTNRRLLFKDGRELNAWLLHSGEEEVQSLGTAGPVDPEIGILAFENVASTLLAVLFNFSLHANAHFGETFSADYPGVVAERLRERYGPQVCSLYMPGACGDQNPSREYDDTGKLLAEAIIAGLDRRAALPEAPKLGISRTRIRVPLRDLHADQQIRLQAAQWPPVVNEFFLNTHRDLLASGIGPDIEATLHAWHIGDVSFATFPGELFIDFSLRLKERGLFSWTYPVQLSNGYLGYLVPQKAYDAIGYESLTSSVGLISPTGAEMMLEQQLKILSELKLKR